MRNVIVDQKKNAKRAIFAAFMTSAYCVRALYVGKYQLIHLISWPLGDQIWRNTLCKHGHFVHQQ